MYTSPYTPTWYQEEDSARMLEYQHALLWADPGTGKTITTLEAAREGGIEKLVVIAPKLALSMWSEEIQKHLGPHKRVVVLRTGGKPPRSWGVMSADAIVTTYGLAGKHGQMLRAYAAQAPTAAALVLDEAHYLKTVTAKRTISIYGTGATGTQLGIASAFSDVWSLTGTPITRYPDDLYAQLRYARAGVLAHYGVGTYQKFVDKFCTVNVRRINGRRITTVAGAKNTELLKRLLDDCFVIRRTLTDVVDDLPKLLSRIVDIDTSGKLPGVDISDLRAVERGLRDPESPYATVRAVLGRSKVAGIAQRTTQLGGPILIGMWHRDAIDELVKALTGLHPRAVVVSVTGDTPDAERDMIQKRFNAGSIHYLVGQMQAMNVSWNLQGSCNTVLIGEEVESPAVVQQFYSRVYRKGQTRPVQLEYLRSEHVLDLAITRIRNKKGDIIDATIN